ncbi:MAG TPA: hypothetical protein ENI06_01660 [Spirochaetales bacterium]|nr:hypothetical protein [Spirochaetales bacterium]
MTQEVLLDLPHRQFVFTVPPKSIQLIRRYGLYSSRTKGYWADMPYVAERTPTGWQEHHPEIDKDAKGAYFDPAAK